MIHRHLTYPEGLEPERLPSAAIVDLFERGDLDDWAPLARGIAAQPFGPLADRVLRLVSAYPTYGASTLWRAWIDRCRARHEAPLRPRPRTPAELRQHRGLTQSELADRIGMSQSDLSKFERRDDVRVSTLRAYAAGLRGRLFLGFEADGRVEPITVGELAPRGRATKMGG